MYRLYACYLKLPNELAEIQKLYENLSAPVTEQEACDIEILRFSNCHIICHKAEGSSSEKKTLAKMRNVLTTLNLDKGDSITTLDRKRDGWKK